MGVLSGELGLEFPPIDRYDVDFEIDHSRDPLPGFDSLQDIALFDTVEMV